MKKHWSRGTVIIPTKQIKGRILHLYLDDIDKPKLVLVNPPEYPNKRNGFKIDNTSDLYKAVDYSWNFDKQTGIFTTAIKVRKVVDMPRRVGDEYARDRRS